MAYNYTNLIIIIAIAFINFNCTLNARIYSLDQPQSNSFNSSISISALTTPDYIYSGNVSNFQISGKCDKDQFFYFNTPISKDVQCISGQFSVELDLTSIADGEVSFSLLDEKYNTISTFSKTKDVQPPSSPIIITDGIAWTSLSSTPLISWNQSIDTGSGFLKYTYSIGTSAGASDIIMWTNITNNSIQLLSGLSLTLNTNYFFNIKAIDKFGNETAVVSSDGWRTVPTILVTTKSTTAVNWNQYYKTASVNTLCDGSENRTTCSHGAEKRIVDLPTYATCNNLSMKDSRDAFYWRCSDGTGHAVFESIKLKEGKGLKDLISSSGVWNPIQAILFSSGIPTGATTDSTWWSNTLTPLPNNDGTGAMPLATSGTIYYTTSDQLSSGYYITGNNIGIVSLNNSKLDFSTGASANCSTSGTAGTSYLALVCSGSVMFNWFEFDTLNNTSYQFYTSSNKFETLNNFSSSKSIIYTGQNLLSSNISTAGLFGGQLLNSIFDNITITSTAFNYSNSASNNLYQRIKSNFSVNMGDFSAWSPSRAMALEIASLTWYFSDRATINNAKISLLNLTFPSNITVNQLAGSNIMASNSTTTKLTGLWLQPTTYACFNISGTDNGFANSTCALGGASNATRVSNVTISDLNNKTKDGINPNDPFIPGATCPTAVHGNSVTTNLESSPKTYLLNAYEIIGDEVGNENGLCESNEACIYMPNFGSYQGVGDYYSNGSCNFQNGTVTGVKMYAYPLQ